MSKQVKVGLDALGHEVPDPNPMALPSGFKRPESLAEQVQRLVRGEVSRRAQEAGHESFEEAEDFDVGEDDDLHTPYETYFDPVLGKELSPQEFMSNQARYRQEYVDRQQREYRDRKLHAALDDVSDVSSVKAAAAPGTPSQEDGGPAPAKP